MFFFYQPSFWGPPPGDCGPSVHAAALIGNKTRDQPIRVQDSGAGNHRHWMALTLRSPSATTPYAVVLISGLCLVS